MEEDYKVSQSELERRKILLQKAKERFKSRININSSLQNTSMEEDYKISQSELERRKLLLEQYNSEVSANQNNTTNIERRKILPQKARERFKSGININSSLQNTSEVTMNQNNTANRNTVDCSINIKDFENHYFNVKKYFKNKETYALCNYFGKHYYVDSVKLYEYEIFTLDTFKNLDDIKENYDILEKNIVKPYDTYCYNNKYLFLIEEEIKENIFIRYKESINSDYVIEYFKEYHGKNDRVYVEIEESKQDIEKDNLAEFFKDKAQVYEVLSNETDKKKNTYTELKIRYSDAERNVLCISANEKPSKICVKYNTYQLENYIKGIKNITEKTEIESFNIFDIFKLIRSKNVITPYPTENIKWEILKDDTRKGCKEQRDFVMKALNTEDICVLEGPPGSGKTTCISELILQILKNNPRAKILLMASTHVAVDNVLERLVDYNLPAVRLGVEDRIADNMKAYKYPEVIDTEYDKFMQCHKNKDIEKYFNSKIGKAEFERLIRNTTNIVCCTTNGIHKYINKQDEIITTDFDYLILDEASKTTIAEFLAVARYAKKWILTGDIKQLSPYTDADELSVSIKKDILYDIGTFIYGVAAYKNKDNQKLIEEKVYPIISKALLCNIKDFDKEDLVHISIPYDFSNDLSFKMCEYIYKNINSNALVYYEILDYNEREKAILENFADIVISTDIFYKKNRKNFYKNPYNKIKYHIWNKHFCNSRSGKTKEEKDIADAISWRLIRDYELRQLKDNEQLKNKYVDKYISEAENLMPKNIQNKIMARQYVVSQSILELTQNTLQETGNKFQSLTYQHRMPDNLAELPRNIIYHGNNMLSNDDNSYVDNTKWYHIVSNGAVTRNYDECKCIIDDIKDIVSSKPNKKVEIAILTFYKAQERLIQEALKSEYGKKNYIEKNNVCIRVATVDRFQGQEADIVMISLSRNKDSGFLNSPNRINVAITRARKIRYMYGNHKFFLQNDNLEIMQAVAQWYRDNNFIEIKLDKKGDK